MKSDNNPKMDCLNSGFKKKAFSLVLFQVFLVLILAAVFLARISQQEKQAAGNDNCLLLEKLKNEVDDAFYIQRQLNLTCGMMAEEPFTAANIGKNLQALRNDGLDFINFRFFDSARRLIPVPGESDNLRVMVQKMYEALSQADINGDGKLLVKYQSLFDAFLGAVSPGHLARERAALVRVLMKGRPGYFYWNIFFSPAGDGTLLGGMLAWFAEDDIPDNLSVRQLIGNFNQASLPDRMAGVINYERPEKSFPGRVPGGFGYTGIAMIADEISRMRRNLESENRFDKTGIFILQVDTARVLYLLEKNAPSPAEKAFFLLKLLMLTLIPFYLYRLLQGGRFEMETCRIEERWRPVFVSLLLVPAVIIASLGFYVAGLQRESVQREYLDRLSRMVQTVDENYHVAISNLNGLYRRFAGLRAVKDLNRPEIAKNFELLREGDAIQRLFLVQSDGKMLMALPDRGSQGETLQKLVSAVSRRLFQSRFGGEQSWKDRINEVMLESFSNSLSEVMGDAASTLFRPFENFDRVSEIMFADRRNFVYSTFVSPEKGRNATLLVGWHGAESFSERYLLRQIYRNGLTAENVQPVRLAMVPAAADRLPFPRAFGKYPFVARLAERVRVTASLQYSEEEIAGKKWLVVASPLKRIPEYLIFAMYPMENADSQMRLTILVIVALAFVSVAGGVWVFSIFFKADKPQTLQ
ncbi:MAG TPA: hypothetical protein PLK28_11615 [Candidatus Rifleibacterium sp.]|nr:hypothetical protein [Candidatus Rifleibacterium sp.]